MTDHETFVMLAARQISEPLSAEEAADLEAHMVVCHTCRSTAAGMRRDDIRLRAELGGAKVSPRVRRRVLDEAAGRRRIAPGILLGLAAALVLGAIGVPLIAGSRSALVPSPSVATPPTSVAPALSPLPSGSGPFVAGAYTYGDDNSRRDSVAAHFEGEVVGEWSRTLPATGEGESYGGPVTCLVISGSDAWLAGPATLATDGSTDRAALVYVHDGELDGSGDQAMLWLTNPGQTLATVTSWCEDRFIPAPPFDLDTGDVVVRDAP